MCGLLWRTCLKSSYCSPAGLSPSGEGDVHKSATTWLAEVTNLGNMADFTFERESALCLRASPSVCPANGFSISGAVSLIYSSREAFCFTFPPSTSTVLSGTNSPVNIL